MSKKLVALFILACVLMGACTSVEGEGPEDVLIRYIENWEKGNWPQMYGLLSEDAQAAVDEETFSARHKNISEGMGLTGLKLTEVRSGENQLEYTLQFITSTVGDFSLDYTMDVLQVEGQWKLQWDHCHIIPDLTAERVVRVSRQMPTRGRIMDRNNLALASMGTVYRVGLVPGDMDDRSISSLALILGLPEADIEKLLNQSWVRDNTFVPVQTLSAQGWSQLREVLTALRGVSVREAVSRVYNIPDSLAQTIGYVGEIEANRLEEWSKYGFAAGDIVGQAGLELVHDRALAGRPGFTISIREDSQVVSVVAAKEAEDGKDVITTLDINKCHLMDTVLADRTGSMLLMDYSSGDILGVTSKPGFDSNLFALGISSRQYKELMELDSPFFNRAFNGLYPPGSIFKPFTALMALEEKVCDPDYSWDTPLQWQNSGDWGAYQVTRVVRPLGPVDLWDAMKWSDNVYFADLGLKVGWESFEAHTSKLGFGETLPFSLTNRQGQVRKNGRSQVLLADTSYGQGEMLATPLQMTLMYSAIARQDGNIPIPRLVETDADDIWMQTGFSQANLELVDRVLAYAASDQDALAWVGQSTVRGKTGTSEVSANRQIAWYICYFDDLVLTVNIEGDRSLGSLQAVALARECLAKGIRD